MDNTQQLKKRLRRYSQYRNQEFFKLSDGLLSSIEDFSNNQLPKQEKDINILSGYYGKKSGNGNFMEKIGKLNKNFYNCSDKYLKSKKMVEKLTDELYLNLFKQIDCYVEEIERLNKKISVNNNQDLKKTIDQLNKEISEKKEKIRNYENKIREKINNEEKLKKDLEYYKRSLIFYKDKIKFLTSNRNAINNIGRETNNTIYYKKKFIKNNTSNYLSPSLDKKNKSMISKNRYNKALNLKLDTEVNKRENILENNDNKEKKLTIIDSGEKIKKVSKKLKMNESVYRESDWFENRLDYDRYGKDIEEKDDDDENSNEFELIRTQEKSKTLKLQNKEDINKNNTEMHSQNISSGFINALTKELYGSPANTAKNTIDNDSSKEVDIFNKNSSGTVSEKKESNEIEKDEKSKTLNKKTNNNKIKKINKFLNNDKKENTKPRINTVNNTNRANKVINKKAENEQNSVSTIKSKNYKTTAKSKPKNNKSIDKVSNFNEAHTPYTKNKQKKQFEKVKEKDIPNSSKTKSGTESEKGNTSSNTMPSVQRRGSKKMTAIVNNKKVDNNTTESNKYISNKRKDGSKNKYDGCKSMSNLNILGRYSNTSKKSKEKSAKKELTSVLNDVNDDYLKSIEMLRKQEEQIKYMLRFIDLDEN